MMPTCSSKARRRGEAEASTSFGRNTLGAALVRRARCASGSARALLGAGLTCSGFAGVGRNALSRLAGDEVSGQVAAALKGADAGQRIALIEILAARRADSEVEALAPLSTDSDAKVRAAAVAALTQLAGPPQVVGLVQAFLAAPAGSERDALERAIAQASLRGEGDKAAPLLAARAALPASAPSE